MRYFLSLGSNLGDKSHNLERAAELLTKAGIRIVSASSVYETEPVGIATEGWFYNQVLEVETHYTPEELIFHLKRIEEDMGRRPSTILRSRSIDIDILLAEDKIVGTKNLQIPHPQLAKRNFVLYPLVEIAPEMVHPLLKEKIITLLERSKDRSRVKKL
ncbi:MAG: 2-amino-4-hydroxy-6-hydroxymethyldihydropteridine diphosphokinase [Candidatus Aminicenantes bacterium]|jgi:2-amino-4-hydroxy-6-hydroxymethyldihydropteridine diphosphokinase